MSTGVGAGATAAVPGLRLRHATATDWDAMADALNRARRADGVEEVRTGEDLAADHDESEMFTLERDGLIAEVDGSVTGYALGHRVVRDGALIAETWGVVAPDYRRRGIGTTLFHAIRERLVTECAEDPRPGPREMRSYALDQETADRALLAAEGFVTIRYGFEMRRYLTGELPAPPLPAGLEMRPVTADQHRAIFDADNEAFEDHWGHRTQVETDFQARFYGPDQDPTLWCVAWDGDEVAGVVMNAIFLTENAALGIKRGWLERVSVRRAWRGRGLATALCAASFRVLRDQGMDEAWLGFGAVRGWQAYGRPLDGPAPAGWCSVGQGAEG